MVKVKRTSSSTAFKFSGQIDNFIRFVFLLESFPKRGSLSKFNSYEITLTWEEAGEEGQEEICRQKEAQKTVNGSAKHNSYFSPNFSSWLSFTSEKSHYYSHIQITTFTYLNFFAR